MFLLDKHKLSRELQTYLALMSGSVGTAPWSLHDKRVEVAANI